MGLHMSSPDELDAPLTPEEETEVQKVIDQIVDALKVRGRFDASWQGDRRIIQKVVEMANERGYYAELKSNGAVTVRRP